MAQNSQTAVLVEMFRVSHNVPSTPAKSLTNEIQERTIWGYWAQGEERMSDFFKLCVDTWKHQNKDWDVRILSRSNLYDYLSAAELPNRFEQMFSPQTSSDCIRLALLSRYGGVWLDVNIILRQSLDELFWNKIESGEASAAACHHPKYGLEDFQQQDFTESWLLATKAGNPFFLRWRDLLKELLHNRLDVKGLMEHPLYQDINLSGFERLNRDFQAPFDFREYLAIHAMFHRLLETDARLRDQWRSSWVKIDAVATGFKIQMQAESESLQAAHVFLGTEERWDAVAEGVPFIKFTTPHHLEITKLPRQVLLSEKVLLGRLLRSAGAGSDGDSGGGDSGGGGGGNWAAVIRLLDQLRDAGVGAREILLKEGLNPPNASSTFSSPSAGGYPPHPQLQRFPTAPAASSTARSPYGPGPGADSKPATSTFPVANPATSAFLSKSSGAARSFQMGMECLARETRPGSSFPLSGVPSAASRASSSFPTLTSFPTASAAAVAASHSQQAAASPLFPEQQPPRFLEPEQPPPIGSDGKGEAAAAAEGRLQMHEETEGPSASEPELETSVLEPSIPGEGITGSESQSYEPVTFNFGLEIGQLRTKGKMSADG
ncbi:unnamed protein product [Polarella glacialis]|uniref:Uncharacterized protein n=1 Tax=Polarella glacialis TaxID=89957 RepID=A0A813IFN7_POLGL|nr:unnamed protein product [Polarella glacialis]